MIDSSAALMETYRRLDVSFSHGAGPWLWDDSGTRYLDALSGIAVCGLGHAHPAVAQAIAAQAGRLIHTSNLYRIERQESLAAKLAQLSGMERAFFGNSGAEANEAAIKIARRYGNERGIAEPAIIAMEDSFHGRTMATLSATGNAKVHAGFEPLLSGFVHVPYDDLAAVAAAIESNAHIVAVLVEPVQGEAGVVVPSADYLNGLRRLCDEHDLLLMLDEIQTGMARSGQWFAYQHCNIVPDVMTLAKGLANGVPIGVCLARAVAAEVLQPGTHGSTFGGNPLAASAGLAVIDVIEREGLVQRAAELGERMVTEFRAELGGLAGIKDIRNMGLMLGIELEQPCAELVGHALQQGLLINVAADSVVRLLPPLVLTDDECGDVVSRVCELVGNFCRARA